MRTGPDLDPDDIPWKLGALLILCALGAVVIICLVTLTGCHGDSDDAALPIVPTAEALEAETTLVCCDFHDRDVCEPIRFRHLTQATKKYGLCFDDCDRCFIRCPQ